MLSPGRKSNAKKTGAERSLGKPGEETRKKTERETRKATRERARKGRTEEARVRQPRQET